MAKLKLLIGNKFELKADFDHSSFRHKNDL